LTPCSLARAWRFWGTYRLHLQGLLLPLALLQLLSGSDWSVWGQIFHA
jgi:hypothetical protein